MQLRLFSVQFLAIRDVKHDEGKNCYRAYKLDTVEKVIQVHGLFYPNIWLYTIRLYKWQFGKSIFPTIALKAVITVLLPIVLRTGHGSPEAMQGSTFSLL